MNGYQRIRAALDGIRPDAAPVMLHNFMMAAREAGITMREYRSDPKAIARAHIEAVAKYGYDGIMVDVDTALLAGAAGVPVAYPDDEPAITHGQLLTSLANVRDLEPVDLARYDRARVWLEGVRLIKAQLGDEIYLRGNCDQCPFALAAAMRGSADWMMDIMDPANAADAHRLLEYCMNVTTQFLELMAATGAHMLSNGDSAAGPSLVSPAIYRAFALPYEKRIADVSHRLGFPYALHICGKTELILDDMVATGSEAMELDFKTDPRRAHDAFAGAITLIGNIDPTGVLALGSIADVETKTRELLDIFADTPRIIVNAGCAIPASTPPENLHAMIRTAHNYSRN